MSHAVQSSGIPLVMQRAKCKKVDLTCTRMDANNYDKLFMLRMDMWDYTVWLCFVCFN